MKRFTAVILLMVTLVFGLTRVGYGTAVLTGTMDKEV